jgi:hypothetical protein
VWHIQNPEFREVGKLDTKRSEDSEEPNIFPWKRSALRKPDYIFPRPPQQENRRDISLEDILIEEDKKQRSRGGGTVQNVVQPKFKGHRIKKGEQNCEIII